MLIYKLFLSCGAYETRTRDPMRDRDNTTRYNDL